MNAPRGWYFASFGEDLRPGGVRPVRYFGERWALFRGRNGVPGVVDARCVHRGADLALAGR
ncbi:MAG: Rieske 2Fe-2S domain-containing protein, partial [Myxococcales bacterium]|nr:Rieske 2Fe-2S domain-containing protein [Myxococcales bacterium]